MATSRHLGNFIDAYGNSNDLSVVSHAHNLFLQLLASTGAVGLLSFCWLVAAASWQWKFDTRTCRIGLGTAPLVLIGIGLTGWNIYDAFYTSLVVYFMAWMGCQDVKSIGRGRPASA